MARSATEWVSVTGGISIIAREVWERFGFTPQATRRKA